MGIRIISPRKIPVVAILQQMDIRIWCIGADTSRLFIESHSGPHLEF